MVYTAADMKRDKKYAREKLLGRMIRYTVPGYGTRDGRIVRYGSVGGGGWLGGGGCPSERNGVWWWHGRTVI